jgi:hypothetical protein
MLTNRWNGGRCGGWFVGDGGFEPLHFEFLVLEYGDQTFDHADRLFGDGGRSERELVLSMSLILRGLLAERPADTFPELQLCSGS